MESTINQPGDPAQSAAGRLKSDLVHGAKEFKDTASGEIRNLMADVEDLLTRVAGVKDQDIRLVRSRVLKTLDAARTSMSASAGRVREHAVKAAGTTNDFVRENPWQALGIAALVGAVVGYLARRGD
jgi:ElaB protein